MVLSFLPISDRPNRQPRPDHLFPLEMADLRSVEADSRHLQPLRHRHVVLRVAGLILERNLGGRRFEPQHRALRPRLLSLSSRLHKFRSLSALHGPLQVFFCILSFGVINIIYVVYFLDIIFYILYVIIFLVKISLLNQAYINSFT